MNRYTYALKYFDEGFRIASFKTVEVIAKTERLAWHKIDESKHDQDWLMVSFDADEAVELDGIIIGDHLLIAQEAVATLESPEGAASTR